MEVLKVTQLYKHIFDSSLSQKFVEFRHGGDCPTRGQATSEIEEGSVSEGVRQENTRVEWCGKRM